MAQYDESGLRLVLADGEHFRFQDLATYQSLKGQRLKEMDFCWLDRTATQDASNQAQWHRLILLELKEFTGLRSLLHESDLTHKAYRFETLINKIVDSLLLLAAAWAGTAKGSQLCADLPMFARQPMRAKVIIGLDLPPSLHPHFGVLRDQLNARMRGRVALFDIERVTLVNYQQLVAKYPRLISRIP